MVVYYTRAKRCVLCGCIYTCFALYCISAVLRDSLLMYL